MQATKYPRFAAVIAAIEQTGKSRAEIGRMAGRDSSATTRWAKGTHMPAWSGAKALADAVRPARPELADEVLAAWHYYSDPVERSPGSAVPPEVLSAIRRNYAPEQQRRAIELLETVGEPSGLPGEGQSGPARERAV